MALVLSLFATTMTAHGQGTSEFSGMRRNVATVIFCGLGGAVLGLSTLSFYGKPQDHTGNIYAGLGAGLIGGLAYVALAPEGEWAFRSGPPRPTLAQFTELPKGKARLTDAPNFTYHWTF